MITSVGVLTGRWQVGSELYNTEFLPHTFPSMCLLFRPGATVGRWPLCGSSLSAAAGADGVLPVEEEEEEGSESVRGAAFSSAFSPSGLCSGDTGVSELPGHVSTMKKLVLSSIYAEQ